MSKPREWYLMNGGFSINGANTVTLAVDKTNQTMSGDQAVHVIEHATYDTVVQERNALAAQLAEAKAEVAEYRSHLGEALKNVPNNYVHKQYHSQVVERLEKALAYAKERVIDHDMPKAMIRAIERLERGE